VPTGGQIWQRFSRTDNFVQNFLSELSTSTKIIDFGCFRNQNVLKLKK
jgi:hypothetical protein